MDETLNNLLCSRSWKYLHPNTPCFLLNPVCCNERLWREGGNNLDCCREKVLNDNLQPRACETDAALPDKTLLFQPSLSLFLPTSHSLQLSSPTTNNPSCCPPPFFSSETLTIMKIYFVVSFCFTCRFFGLTHCALVQMNVSAPAMVYPHWRNQAEHRTGPQATSLLLPVHTLLTSDLHDCGH